MIKNHTNCTVEEINVSSITPLINEVLSTEKSQRMAEFFSFLGDANRLRILSF